MKAYTLLLLIIISNTVFAQTKALDFVVKNTNDTIYGALQKDKLVQLNADKTLKIYSLDSVSTLRKNDVIYKRVSGNFKADKELILHFYTDEFISVIKKEKDFIINKEKDSVFGTIKSPLFGPKFIKTERGKTKICSDETLSYKKHNIIYDLKTLGNPILSSDKTVFLKRLYKGKANLYAYKVLKSDVGTVKPKTFYIIEKNDTLHLISNTKAKQDLIDLFIADLPLTDLIFDGFYSPENIYLIVKAYDLN